MTTRSIVILPLALAAIGACRSESPPPRHDASTTAARVVVPPSDSARRTEAQPERFTGDTLTLASIGGQPPTDWRDPKIPCDVSRPIVSERIVFADDTMYVGTRVTSTRCDSIAGAPTDSAVWASPYRVRGDTLMLFQGDGDEVFQWYNGRIAGDSILEITSDPSRAWSFVRHRRRR